MKPKVRTLGRCAVGLLGLALLLQGCGAQAPKNGAAPTPYRGTLPALETVQFVTPQIGFMAGQGIVLETTDAGSVWTRIYSGSATIQSVDFVGKSAGWVLTSDGKVLAWTGGSAWTPVAQTLGQAAAMHLFPGGAGLVVTAKGALYHAAKASGPWQQVNVAGIRSLSFSSSTVGWAVAAGGTAAPTIVETKDGGLTWTHSFAPQLGQPETWSASVAASGNAAWALYTSASGQLEHQPYVAYATQDQGQHWQEQIGAPLFSGSGGMYPSSSQSLFGLQAGAFAALGQSAYFLSWQPDPSGNLLGLTSTADAGATWHQVPLHVKAADLPDFFEPIGLALPGPATIWIVGSRGGNGVAVFSRDGGAHWSAPAL